MDSLIFRAALRAAAKVALTAAVTGCGGIEANAARLSEGGPPDVVDSSIADSRLWDSSLLDSTVTDSTDGLAPDSQVMACNAPPEGNLLPEFSHPDASVSQAVFDCCASRMGATFSADGGSMEPLDAAANDPNVLSCCAAIMVRLDEDWFDVAAFSADQTTIADAGLATSSCCDILHWSSGPSCDPWGPPMPPEMPTTATRPDGPPEVA